MHPSRTVQILVAAAAAFLSATSMAHGNAGRSAAPRSHDPSKVEETPFGREGNPAQVTRTIRVDMRDDMRFSPALISVKAGETVRLVASNKGRGLHEMVLGTPKDLQEHAALMRKFPDMEHDAPHMTHVKPGQRGEIVWQFSQPGEFQFGCLMAGHFESGMVGTIVVR